MYEFKVQWGLYIFKKLWMIGKLKLKSMILKVENCYPKQENGEGTWIHFTDIHAQNTQLGYYLK